MTIISLKNSFFSLSLRSFGAKMTSFKFKQEGKETELLYLPPNPPNSPKLPNPGDVFDQNSAWGGDICLPTVAMCEVKLGNYLLKSNDHGDFWTTEFKIKKHSNNAATLVGQTREFGLEVDFSLQGASLIRSYTITNLTKFRLPFIFADHLLLPVGEVNLPHVKKMFVEWSYDNKLGKKGEIINYPLKREKPFADKLFSPLKKKYGYYCAGYKIYNRYNNYILLTLSSKELSFLGYWHTEGGWPASAKASAGKHDQYNLGLELTNSNSDNLKESVKSGKVWWIKPGSNLTWSIELTVIWSS